jgi:hypothetical protein
MRLKGKKVWKKKRKFDVSMEYRQIFPVSLDVLRD